ncbi:Hsp20/alpha crystallin family protein [Roseivirga thermotolerans]|uniref:Hsp20/alpha crystallin family protein n=2 Tax=Roseivirga thermotolerans TaxID=1758176 RepID=UPI00273FE919|nr:Hsp20/alpha crystallin family protein [Roseivirga thermotolerans]
MKTKKTEDMNLVRRNSDWFVPSTMDKFFDRFFNESFDNVATTFNPRTDIAETDKAFEIEVAVPGFDKKDFNIDLNDGLLTISGERKFEKKQSEKNFYSIQTEYGTFKKSFQLPDNIQSDKIEATYENGILSLIIPKDETKKLASKISVK